MLKRKGDVIKHRDIERKKESKKDRLKKSQGLFVEMCISTIASQGLSLNDVTEKSLPTQSFQWEMRGE